MMDRPKLPHTTWQIFRWPLAVAILSLVGLLSALIGDGWNDLVSWLALGLTLGLMITAWYRSKR